MYNAAEMKDLMLQTTARNSVLSGGCPSLGSNLVPRASTYLSALQPFCQRRTPHVLLRLSWNPTKKN